MRSKEREVQGGGSRRRSKEEAQGGGPRRRPKEEVQEGEVQEEAHDKFRRKPAMGSGRRCKRRHRSSKRGGGSITMLALVSRVALRDSFLSEL